MIGTILCAAVVTLGVEFGWEPNDQGGLEYIVQIDAETLKSLAEGGAPLRSDFPRDLQGLETIRFQVGGKKPPRIALSPPLLPPLSTQQQAAKQPGKLPNNPRGEPLRAQKAAFEEPSKTADVPKIEDNSQDDKPPALQKPWPLLYASLALTIGLAVAFCYLLWLHVDMRARYRTLLSKSHNY